MTRSIVFRQRIFPAIGIIWVLSSCMAVQAQDTGRITGRIVDSLTGVPLPGATVILENGTGTTTSATGNFELTVSSGDHTLIIRYLGYRKSARKVFVDPGDVLSLTIPLVPESELLDEIVVSAGKFEQKLSEVTLSMVVVKPVMVENNTSWSLDEALNRIPGIEILDGQPGIRGGSGYSYGAGSRVLMVVDGLPLMSGDAGDVKWNFLPVQNLRQVEIIKGASSVLYGSSALNGVINLRTRDPGPVPESSVRAIAGFFMKPPRPEWVWSDKLRWFAGISANTLRKSGTTDVAAGMNLYTNTGYREDEYEKRLRVNLNLDFHPQSLQGLTYGVHLNGMVVNSSDFFLWQNADSGALRQNPAGVVPLNGVRLTVDPHLSYHTSGGGLHVLKTRLFANLNEMPDDPDKNNRFNLVLGEYRYHKPISEAVRLTLGMAENYARVFSNLYGDHDRNEMALYGQIDSRIGERLITTFGVRWENYRLDETWTLAKPIVRAGINYKLFTLTNIRFSFGQGYRYPSIAEKYTATQLGSLNIFPNPALVPEEGWSAEAGVYQAFTFGYWKGALDLALYRNEYHNMIEFAFGLYLPDSITIPDLRYVGFKALNVGRARITGTEVTLTLNRTLGNSTLDFSAGYNYNNPVDLNIPKSDTINNILKYRYRHSFKGDVQWERKKISAGLSLVATGFMERVDSVFIDPLFGNAIMPGYPKYRSSHRHGALVLDLHLGYLAFRNTRFLLNIKNLLNREYIGRPGDIQPPRSVTLQIQGKF